VAEIPRTTSGEFQKVPVLNCFSIVTMFIEFLVKRKTISVASSRI